MILLQNGCAYSGLSVNPSNWEKPRVSLKKEWYIYYRFYSPDYPKGKLKVIKSGINRISNLVQRREAVKGLLKLEKNLLEKEGYNPILNVRAEFSETVSETQNELQAAINTEPCSEPVADIPNETNCEEYIIAPSCRFIEALRKSYDRLDLQDSTKLALRGVIKGISKAARALTMTAKPIGEVKRRHLLLLLDYCSKKNPNWSNARYNKYRAYLLMLYKELVHVEAVEFNPVRDIIRKKEYKKIREVLTQEQRKLVDTYLRERYYTFWRFMHIFFHSGAREIELMGVTKEKVFLREQYFIVTILKRGAPTEVKKPIKSIVKPLWEEIYNNAEPGQYLFSKFLKPGNVQIDAAQITRRWREHVKKKLGIAADFYCLKHMNLDEIEDILSLQEAAKQASHLSTSTTEIYTIGKQLRDLIKLQNVENAFA